MKYILIIGFEDEWFKEEIFNDVAEMLQIAVYYLTDASESIQSLWGYCPSKDETIISWTR